MSEGDPVPGQGHSIGVYQGTHPRAYRTERHLIYETATSGRYRIALSRLRCHGDLLLVLQWLTRQEGVTLESIEPFIRVACNAAGLPQPGQNEPSR